MSCQWACHRRGMALVELLFSSLQSLSRVWLFAPHGQQHISPPRATSAPGVYSHSCPLTQWWHPALSSSVIPSSSLLQSSPASGSFPMSQFFTTGGQSIGASASASVLPMYIQDWFPLGLIGRISLSCCNYSQISWTQHETLSHVGTSTMLDLVCLCSPNIQYSAVLCSMTSDSWQPHGL